MTDQPSNSDLMKEEAENTPRNLNEEEATMWRRMSSRVRQQMQDSDMRIRGLTSAHDVWENLLTEQEQVELGGDLENVWRSLGTLGMWMRIKGYSNRFAALLDLSDQITDPRKRLARATGLVVSQDRTTLRPRWNRSTGILDFNGQEIRRIRLFRNPTNIQRILDAFQDAGWSEAIDNPFDEPSDQQKLHLALHQLNKGLIKIRFSGTAGARRVTWAIADSTSK